MLRTMELADPRDSATRGVTAHCATSLQASRKAPISRPSSHLHQVCEPAGRVRTRGQLCTQARQTRPPLPGAIFVAPPWRRWDPRRRPRGAAALPHTGAWEDRRYRRAGAEDGADRPGCRDSEAQSRDRRGAAQPPRPPQSRSGRDSQRGAVRAAAARAGEGGDRQGPQAAPG